MSAPMFMPLLKARIPVSNRSPATSSSGCWADSRDYIRPAQIISCFFEISLDTLWRSQGIIISTFREMEKSMHKPDSERLDVAAMFKALGDPTRLHIFEFLRSCRGPVAVEETGAVRPIVGPTVGEVCCHV